MPYILQEEKYVERGWITFQLPLTTICDPLTRQLSLTHDMDDIVLHNHFIVEVGVALKEQSDFAAIMVTSEFLNLPGKSR